MLAILVADCLPVLLASATARVVAAAHAGWRGLAAGVLEATVARDAGATRAASAAWLGRRSARGISKWARRCARRSWPQDPRAAERHLSRNARGRWQCDLLPLARARLAALGVSAVSGCRCLHLRRAEHCFSYRRDGRTGRMAALIWRPS